MKKNLVVTLADENYIEQAKQLFSSVYWNAGWKGDYMLLAHEIPEKKLKWFRDKGILVKKCKPLNNKKSEKHSVYLSKLYLFTSEFKKWENIVYLDSDIIVCGPLNELIKIKGFAAKKKKKISKMFINTLFTKIESVNKKTLNQLKKNYNLKKRGFNSGVMVFCTDIIKKNAFSKLKELYKVYKEIRIHKDQGILNLFFYEKWAKLPLTFNWRYHYIGFSIFNKKPKSAISRIIHFAGNTKPWNSKCSFYNEWKDNLKKANLINIKRPYMPSGKFAKEETEKQSKNLKRKDSLYSLIWTLDRAFGIIGIFLRKNFPMLYFKLKKLEKIK